MVHGLHDVRAPGEKVEMTRMVIDSLLEQMQDAGARSIQAGKRALKVKGPVDTETAQVHAQALDMVLDCQQIAHDAIRNGDLGAARRAADLSQFWCRVAVTTMNALVVGR